MGNENLYPQQETPVENGENNGEEAGVVEEGEIETEEKVLMEIPDEVLEMDPEALESLKGVPEAPMEEDDEE